MRLPLCYPIESRDGTLNADSKMKNLVVENVEGELVAVKRPGVTKQTELPPGLAQGLFSLNGLTYAIFNDLFVAVDSLATGISWGYSLTTGASLSYSAGTTYNANDPVIGTDENGVETVFYAVQTVTGVRPARTTAAFPYWSKYKNLNVGTPPSIGYTTTGPTVISDNGLGAIELATTVRLTVGGVYYSTIYGYVSQGPTFAYWDSVYVNYNNAGLLMNGTDSNHGGGTHITYTAIADNGQYLAAKDYARHLV